ncbi:hypothetical protein ANCCAN_01777 [Ancylostoma caninum]|uniref:Uncharacterized protein n=1 Tax=Ancylostoma caninum TaxID=29170 RepID=A0A368H9G7_ANCCA|nr:hypothetical protein ANCCAN_01777 [Ancylostoma caninum]
MVIKSNITVLYHFWKISRLDKVHPSTSQLSAAFRIVQKQYSHRALFIREGFLALSQVLFNGAIAQIDSGSFTGASSFQHVVLPVRNFPSGMGNGPKADVVEKLFLSTPLKLCNDYMSMCA